MTEGDFDGYYFENRKLSLDSGNPETGWDVCVNHTDGTIDKYTYTDSKIDLLIKNYKINESDSVSVLCLPNSTTNVICNYHLNDGDVVYYNLGGMKTQTTSHGVYIIKKKGNVEKIIK